MPGALLSVARLSPCGDPRLCAPASRRVCLCRGATKRLPPPYEPAHLTALYNKMHVQKHTLSKNGTPLLRGRNYPRTRAPFATPRTSENPLRAKFEEYGAA